MDLITSLRQDPDGLAERLSLRAPDGKYIVSESELVIAIRALRGDGRYEEANKLSTVLLARCEPIFVQHTRGLSHRPDLREDAISSMKEQLLREMINPRASFLILNFPHTLRCLCFDVFKRILRDDQRGSAQVVAEKVAAWVYPQNGTEAAQSGEDFDILDPYNPYEHFHAQEEVRRLLYYLPNSMDRTIMQLRAIEQMKWADIALQCRRTERAVRRRYTNACALLRQYLYAEQTMDLLHC